MGLLDELEFIPITVASPETWLEWTHGEEQILTPLNSKSYQPLEEGLFCESIFGIKGTVDEK